MTIREPLRQLRGMSSLSVASSLTPVIGRETTSCIEAFQKEFDYLCRTLRRLGVPASDIEDEVHEVFLVLSRKWDAYDPTRPLRPYLFGIAFRVVAARRRRANRSVSTGYYDVESAYPLPDEELETAHARQLVLRALSRVPLQRRAVLVMHDIDEVPMREVALALSLPLFTGYSRLRKARKEFEAAIRSLRTKGPER